MCFSVQVFTWTEDWALLSMRAPRPCSSHRLPRQIRPHRPLMANPWQRAPVLPWAPGEAGHEFCSEMALILSLWRNILLSWHRILFFVECVLKPLVHEGAIFHNRPILRPQIRCLWNKSFLSFGNYFFLSSFKLQFSSTDTVNFISRGSDIPQSVEKIYISTWSLSESFVVKSK